MTGGGIAFGRSGPPAGMFAPSVKEVFRVSPHARVVMGDLEGLLAALSEPGRAFRIGGTGPLQATAAEFETLTSGSSGSARRIRRTMASWTQSFAVNARLFGIGPGKRVAVLGRMEQSLALYGAVEALHLGADLLALGDLRPDRQRRALAQADAWVLYATPAQLRLLVEAGGPLLPGLRVVLVGGSKLDDALRAALGSLSPGAALHEFYGAAEASFITLAGPEDPPQSVGRPYPGVEIRAPLDGVGEVWVRSPYLFTAYAGDEAGSARWQDGWLGLGEMGRMVDGFLYLAGRAGRMVTVADHNVFPEEIEVFLLGLPGVERAAVLPRPDPRRGVHLVAVLRGDPGQGPAIQGALRARLGPTKAPKALIWLQDWPTLPSGKTDLASLASQIAAAGERP